MYIVCGFASYRNCTWTLCLDPQSPVHKSNQEMWKEMTNREITSNVCTNSVLKMGNFVTCPLTLAYCNFDHVVGYIFVVSKLILHLISLMPDVWSLFCDVSDLIRCRTENLTGIKTSDRDVTCK